MPGGLHWSSGQSPNNHGHAAGSRLFPAKGVVFSGQPDVGLTVIVRQMGYSTDDRSCQYKLIIPFRTGWPAPVRLVVSNLLPTIGTGAPGAPALADLDGSGTLKVAIFGTAGPVAIYDADGRSLLGQFAGRTRSLAMDFPDGFPRVPESAGSADAPFFAALGSGIFGDLDGNGLPEYVAPTAGLRKLLDVAAAAQQTLGDHQVTAWNPLDGSLVPAFPLPMDDAQFLCGPSLGDVDGDGLPEILQGSGSYLLRAFKNDGSQPEGWPKFTHGWLFCAPSAGDVDGDGLIEVIATTREGRLYIWNTPAPASEAGIPWQGFGRDRRNTQNLSSAVPTTVTPESPLLAADEGLVPRSRNSAAHGARDQP